MPFEEAVTKKFEVPPEGLHNFRLAWLIDIGTHEDKFKDEVKHAKKLLLGFELVDTFMEDGKPFLVSKEFNLTESKFVDAVTGEKKYYASQQSNLHKLMKDWLKEDEAACSRLGTLAKALREETPGQLMISHEEREKEGKKKTYTKLELFKPLKAGSSAGKRVTPTINFSIGDEITPIIPAWVQKRILASEELTKAPTDSSPETIDEDVPF